MDIELTKAEMQALSAQLKYDGYALTVGMARTVEIIIEARLQVEEEVRGLTDPTGRRSRPWDLMTPQENFDRTEDIVCPTHAVTILPAAVCPFCKYPESSEEEGMQAAQHYKEMQGRAPKHFSETDEAKLYEELKKSGYFDRRRRS